MMKLRRVHETDQERLYRTPIIGSVRFGIGIVLIAIGSGMLLKVGELNCRRSEPQIDCPPISSVILNQPIALSGSVVLLIGLITGVRSVFVPQRSLRLNRSTQQLTITRWFGLFPISQSYPSSIVQKLSRVQESQKGGTTCFKAVLPVGDTSLTLAEGSRYAVADFIAEIQRFWGFPVRMDDADQMPYSALSVKSTLQTPFHISAIAVSSDGQWLAIGGVFRSEKGAVVSKPGTLQIWNLQTRQLHHALPGNPKGVSHVVFSPDSQRLAISCNSAAISLYEVATGTELQQLPMPKLAIRNELFMFTPDGKGILFAGEDDPLLGSPDNLREFMANDEVRFKHHVVQQWDLTTDPPTLREVVKLQDPPTALAISPDGQHLAVEVWTERLRVWQVSNQMLLADIVHAEQVTSVLFSPDSRYVLYGSDCAGAMNYPQIGVYDITQTTSRKALQPSVSAGSAVRCFAISPDGRVVAVVQDLSHQTEIPLVDFESGDVLDCLIAKQAVREIAFLPDGRSLLTVSSPQVVDIWQ